MTENLRDRLAKALSARFAAKNGSCDPITRQAHYDTAGFVMTIVGPEVARRDARIVELTALLNDHGRLMEHIRALREFDAIADEQAHVDRLADGGEV